jgi:cell division protein FtsQ
MTSRVVGAEERLRQRAREQRRARRRTWLRRGGWVLAAIAPFVLAAWVLLGSGWLVVDRVQVTGESRVSEAEVLAAVSVRLGTPLARVDTGAVEERVRSLGPVADVEVSRGWPGTLKVAVVEREPFVAVKQGASWALYDATGTQLGTATALPARLAELRVAHPGPDDPTTTAALKVLAGLPTGLRARVGVLRAGTAENVVLELRDGRRVVWGGADESRAKVAALLPLLRLPGRVYDVSSPAVVTRR